MTASKIGNRGRPRKADASIETERVRKTRTKAKTRVHSPEELAAKANEGFHENNAGLDKIQRGSVAVAERITRKAMSELAPSGGMFTPEVMKEAQAMSREALLLMARSIPELTATVIRKANEGDATCLSIVARWLPNPNDAVTLSLPAGMTPEEASSYLAGAGLSGDLSVKDAKEGLRLLELHGHVHLNAALTARVEALRKELEKVQAVSPNALSGQTLARPTARLRADGTLEPIDVEQANENQ